MLIADVLLKLQLVLFQCRPVDSADEAQILFVIFDVLPLIPELCESVRHDTRDDIAEEQRIEDKVGGIVEELGRVPN